LQCVFQNADEIAWKCNGRSVSDREFSTSSDDGVVKSVLTVSRMEVLSFFGNDDFWCMCQIRDSKRADQGWIKSQRSFIVHSCKSPSIKFHRKQNQSQVHKINVSLLDLHNKFQKPLPQSGGVKFGEKFVLDCRPPAGNPKPLGKLLKKRTRVKFEISGAPDPHARKCSSVELTCQLIVNLGPLLVYRQSAARVLPATST